MLLPWAGKQNDDGEKPEEESLPKERVQKLEG